MTDDEAIRAGEAHVDVRQFVADVDQIRGAYGFLLMRLAVTDGPDDTFAVCKKEEAANREAFARLEQLLSRPGLSNHQSWDALVEQLRAASDAPERDTRLTGQLHALYRQFFDKPASERYEESVRDWASFDKGYTQAINDVHALLASRSLETETYWKALGNLLQSGGMYDPAFLVGMVRGELASRVSATTDTDP